MKNFLINAFVRYLKFKPISIGVPVIIKNKKGEILLGKRDSNSVFYPSMWGLPGGLLEYKETFEQCAKREIKEEMGIEIKIIKKSNEIYEIIPSKDYPFHSINIVFHAKIKKRIPKSKDETQEVKWFKPKEIKNMNLAYTHKSILKTEGILK